MKINSGIKVLIFDMDGTLVNSEPVGPETFIEIAIKYGTKPSDRQYQDFIDSWRRTGPIIDEKIVLGDFVERRSLPIKKQDFISEFFETYEINLAKASPIEGAGAFLFRAKKQGYSMAIVSASKLKQVEIVLDRQNWTDLFDLIVSEESITKHKPDPQGYNKAIEHFGVSPGECVVFEDSKNGSIAAKASGAFVVGLRGGHSNQADLSAADAVVNTFSELELSP